MYTYIYNSRALKIRFFRFTANFQVCETNQDIRVVISAMEQHAVCIIRTKNDRGNLFVVSSRQNIHDDHDPHGIAGLANKSGFEAVT